MHDQLKKCGFCGRELIPVGFDYLYANISYYCIQYERCTGNKAQEYEIEKTS